MKSVKQKLRGNSISNSVLNSLCNSNQLASARLLPKGNIFRMPLTMLITLQDDIVWVLSEVLESI